MDLRERPDGATRHPWETSRARFFRKLIAGSITEPPDRVLDVGSGDSWFASTLLADLPATTYIDCWDPHYTAADLAETVNPRLHRTTAGPDSRYPLVIALDVLEHIEDAARFVVEQLAPAVQPGGLLLASVPAHQSLFTSHDQALGHFRRHSAKSLRMLLAPTFTVTQQGSLFTSLLPARAAQRLHEMVRPPNDASTEINSVWSHGPLLSRAVTAMLDIDARTGLAASRRRFPLPGLTVWAVCRMDRTA